jgi:hypothetical protein
MSYRNKTYVAFASENIRYYRLMEAWRENEHIEFDFFDAHDLFISRATSRPETTKRNLRERLKNAKQVVLLGSADAKRRGSDGTSFLAHEVKVMMEFNLPVVVANLDGDRKIDRNFIPTPLLGADYYTLSTSFCTFTLLEPCPPAARSSATWRSFRSASPTPLVGDWRPLFHRALRPIEPWKPA